MISREEEKGTLFIVCCICRVLAGKVMRIYSQELELKRDLGEHFSESVLCCGGGERILCNMSKGLGKTSEDDYGNNPHLTFFF